MYTNVTAIKQNMTSGGNLAFHNFNNDFAHISNANERRRLALAEIDKAPFGWYHVRAIAVAGVSGGDDYYHFVNHGILGTKSEQLTKFIYRLASSQIRTIFLL